MNQSNPVLVEIASRLLERSRIFHGCSIIHAQSAQINASEGKRFDYHTASSFTYASMADRADKELLKLLRANPSVCIPQICTLESLNESVSSVTNTTDATSALTHSDIDLSEALRSIELALQS